MKLLKYTLTLSIPFLFLACSGEKKTEKNEKSDSGKSESEKYVEGNNSLLYEITGNGLTSPSYLFGTMHIISEDLFFTGDNLISKFKNVEILAMEVEDITNIGGLASVATDLYLDSGSVRDYATDSVYKNFLQVVEEKKGLSQAQFEQQYGKMKPFAMYTLVSGEQEASGDSKSYERYFMNLAYDNDLDLAGLETLDDQLKIFNNVTFDDMLNYIAKALNAENEADESQIEQLGKVYASQNLDSIAAFALDSDDMLMTKYRNDFLDQRNKNWIPVIDSLVHKHPTFIAVGAAHLPGEVGVINLLRKEGYTIKAVSIE